jgi:hypothetical protein
MQKQQRCQHLYLVFLLNSILNLLIFSFKIAQFLGSLQAYTNWNEKIILG